MSLMLIAAAACSDDDDKKAAECKLGTITTEATNKPTQTTNFTYSANGHLTNVDLTYAGTKYHFDVETDGEGRITKISNNNSTTTYTYIDNLTVSENLHYKIGTTNNFGDTESKLEFNANKQLEKITCLSGCLGTDYIRYEYNSSGNLTKTYWKRTSANGETLFQESSNYDNKHKFANPMYFEILSSFDFTSVNAFLPRDYSVNNVTTQTTYYASNTFAANLKYTYNDVGYPIAGTLTGSADYKFTYELDCK